MPPRALVHGDHVGLISWSLHEWSRGFPG